ncbi:MAG: hypothetical protein K6E93_10145 [Bacteroidales bacterium]|jgi:hypothetical protein|nr:hypothetical protein [Bacteroidales bacterium]
MKKVFLMSALLSVIFVFAACNSPYKKTVKIVENAIAQMEQAQTCDELMAVLENTPEGYDEATDALTEEEMAELEEGLFKKFGEVMHAKAEELGCNCGKEEPAPAATAAPKQETSTAADELKEAGKDILDDVVKSIGEPSK